MQDAQLLIARIFERAEQLAPSKPIVTGLGGTERRRRTYGDWARRSRQLGSALDALGVSEDGRVASLAWNSDNHLELYFGVPCTGRVLHTVNVRLFADQLEYVIDHAGDEVIFCDRSVADVLAEVLPRLKRVRHVVLMDDGADDRLDDARVVDYEELLADVEPAEFPELDENRAAYICYTSGTTGRPKGVVYSHRSTYLHTLGVVAPDALNVSERDAVLPVVPMFHALAWGLAHAAVLTGAALVMPGRDLSAPTLAALIEDNRPTLAAGVPTVWIALLDELDGRDVSSLSQIVCGGSAVPRALSEAYRERTGSPIVQAWGMTELHPVGTVNRLKSTLGGLTLEERADLGTAAGLPVAGVEVRIVDLESGNPLAWGGESRGELQCRGPWVARSYFDDTEGANAFTEDGWLRTGDIATIDAHGYVRIVDRTKDLIKSGGEWISSVELENELMAHPDITEAAVVAIPDEKWQERPAACVVARSGRSVERDEVVEFLSTRVPKWWLPDVVVQMDSLPRTATGKFSKLTLRDRLADELDRNS